MSKRCGRGGVPTVEMEKIESVVDKAHAALAVARGLRLRKAGQAILANAAQLAVEISCLRTDLRQLGDDARILVGPIEARPREQSRPAALDSRGHAKAVQLDLVEPLRPGTGRFA